MLCRLAGDLPKPHTFERYFTLETLRRQTESAKDEAVRQEQSYVSLFYRHLNREIQRAETALRAEHARGAAGGTRQARFERDVAADRNARRIAQLAGVERGLCFGRIDDTDGGTYHIGRVGLRDEEFETLLVDWRAPAARAFYVATPNDPQGLVRRRHLHTRGRRIVDVDDEVFDLERMSESDRTTLVGEAALLASLRRGRTGRMSEVVATIQAEQDRVIRSSLMGALVVHGGPGTGKTVAALHRAAYLLYTHRDTLERRGILVVGPNATFSRYIELVLPSLGETDVVLSSVGELYPGIHATVSDEPAVAAVKGDLRMAGVIEATVRDRQRVPHDDVEIAIDVRTSRRDGVEVVVEEMTLRLDREACARARDRARALREPHNVARKLFVHDALRALALDEARQLDRPMDANDLRYAKAALWQRRQVREALDELWPLLTPERLVRELFTDAGALASAGGQGGLSAHEGRTLLRPAAAPWTTEDVPLLDEAAELLGAEGTEATAREHDAERERQADERYAQGVLELTGLSEEGTLDPDRVADQYRDTGPSSTTADRAATDRQWAYGHVIVDEAQELSQMAWRTVMRRIPTRSLTIVGDLAQTGSAAGARSWGEMLDRYLAGRWREECLLINYRTPTEIMEVATEVLKAVAPEQEPPLSVRDGEAAPTAVPTTRTDLPATLHRVVESELAEIGEGRAAVVTPNARHAEITAWLSADASHRTLDVLDAPVAVLTVSQAKGLEFDAVVLVTPDEILAQSPKGGHDLYVAITRATRRLTVVHEEELPEMLGKLATARR